MRCGGQTALHAGGALRRDDALRGGSIELALGVDEEHGGVLGLASRGRSRLLHGGAERALYGAVAVGALDALAVPFLGGGVIGHFDSYFCFSVWVGFASGAFAS